MEGLFTSWAAVPVKGAMSSCRSSLPLIRTFTSQWSLSVLAIWR